MSLLCDSGMSHSKETQFKAGFLTNINNIKLRLTMIIASTLVYFYMKLA